MPDETRLQFVDAFTITHGSHTLKFGGDINHVEDILDQLFSEAGVYTYADLSNFVIDYVNFTTAGSLRAANRTCATGTLVAGKCYTSNYTQGFGPPRFTINTMDYAFFGQDNWRVTPRFTLNLGLRWEYQKFPALFSNLVNPNLVINGDVVTSHRPSDKNNFGPRVGFAWDLTGDAKTSLRGGWGMYYGRSVNSTIINSLINTGLASGQIVSSVPAACPTVNGFAPGNPNNTACPTAASVPLGNPAAPLFANILTTAPAGTASVQYFANGFQNPLIHQGDLVLEREVGHNTAISVSYLFSFGKYLPNFVDVNLTAPTTSRAISIVDGPYAGQTWTIPYLTGARPIAGFGAIQEIRSNVDTKYHGLVLQANRRLTNGLQFQVNYTLSRAQDTGQGSQTFTPTFPLTFNPFDQGAEKGYSAFDRRHKFVASVVYNTHFKTDNSTARHILNGWTISPVFTMFSGARFTANTNSFTTSAAFGTSQAGGVNGANSSLRFALLPNNFFKQPSIQYLDMRISRRFTIHEDIKLELLAEGFNLFNRTQVTSVNSTIYNLCIPSAANPTACPFGAPNSGVFAVFNPAFQQVTGADGFFFRERQVQLAARFQF